MRSERQDQLSDAAKRLFGISDSRWTQMSEAERRRWRYKVAPLLH